MVQGKSPQDGNRASGHAHKHSHDKDHAQRAQEQGARKHQSPAHEVPKNNQPSNKLPPNTATADGEPLHWAVNVENGVATSLMSLPEDTVNRHIRNNPLSVDKTLEYSALLHTAKQYLVSFFPSCNVEPLGFHAMKGQAAKGVNGNPESDGRGSRYDITAYFCCTPSHVQGAFPHRHPGALAYQSPQSPNMRGFEPKVLFDRPSSASDSGLAYDHLDDGLGTTAPRVGRQEGQDQRGKRRHNAYLSDDDNDLYNASPRRRRHARHRRDPYGQENSSVLQQILAAFNKGKNMAEAILDRFTQYAKTRERQGREELRLLEELVERKSAPRQHHTRRRNHTYPTSSDESESSANEGHARNARRRRPLQQQERHPIDSDAGFSGSASETTSDSSSDARSPSPVRRQPARKSTHRTGKKHHNNRSRGRRRQHNANSYHGRHGHH